MIGKFITLFFRNSDSHFAPKGMYGGYQWFIPHPKFEWRNVRRKCRVGYYVFDEGSMSKSVWPGCASNRQLDTFQHCDCHTDHCLIDMFGHTILLQSVWIGLLMDNPVAFQILDEVILEILSITITM